MLIESADDYAVFTGLNSVGVAPKRVAQGLLSANLSLEDLDELEGMSQVMAHVRQIEQMHLHRTHRDRALPAAGFPPGVDWGHAIREDGTGTIIAVIDTGFDLSHRCFYDLAGQLRVDALLDQTAPGGEAVYSGDALQKAWSSGATPGFDADGHGTHVASIAAGSLFGQRRGVAPGARLILVKTDFRNVVDALRWVFEKAGDTPCVVNCSWGHHFGAHDGSSLEERRGPESLIGPGRIVVAAAGNSGSAPIHCSGDFSPGQHREVPFTICPQPGEMIITGWYAKTDDFRMELISPAGETFLCPPPEAPANHGLSGAAEVQISSGFYQPGDLVQVLVKVERAFPVPEFRSEGWILRITAGALDKGRVDLWIGHEDMGRFEEQGNSMLNPESTLTLPATSSAVISVGSFVSANQWEGSPDLCHHPEIPVGKISPFSSRGPTRDGRQAPDVVAPGQFVAAARSTHCARQHHTILEGGAEMVLSGTSQSAPVISGLISLMLQRNNKLTTEDVRRLLQQSALRDQWTGSDRWDPLYGSGKVQGEAAINMLPALQTNGTTI